MNSEPVAATGWKSPIVILMLMAIAMQVSHQTWFTLLNNFAIDEVKFTGREIGILQSLREIPGFLSFAVVWLLLVLREQRLALVALLALGIGTATTGYFPTEYGFYATCMLMSLGFHYYETVHQSLALQWLPKAEAPQALGRIMAAGSFAALATFGIIYLTFWTLKLDFRHVYLLSGAITVVTVIWLWLAFPMFPQKVVQNKHLVLRQRYWLYYALTFMGGARRQIFIVFAGFMMVEKFGYSVIAITTLFLINHVFNMVLAPRIGRLIGNIGERAALIFEYIGLACIFAAYAFVEDPIIAGILYVADHGFFALAIAMKTYFQKIADPADIAPTAGVAFTINHIAAVFLPVVLGYVWLRDPSSVFLLGAAMAIVSLLLSLLVPRHPAPGQELVWSGRAAPTAAG